MPQPIQWSDLIVPNAGIDETLSPQKIDDRAWLAAENVEPLFDGVRARLGSAKSNTDPIPAINLSHTDGTADREFADGTSEYISQGFTVGGSDITLYRVAVRLKTSDGSPTGNVTCAIYTDSAGEPDSSSVTGFSTVNSAGTTSDYKWYVFTKSGGATLTASTVYHIVLFHDGAGSTGTDNISVEEDTGGGYAGGQVNFSTDGSSWTAAAGSDLNFRVYAGSEEITGIFDYKLSDQSAERHILTAGKEVYKNDAGTMTEVSNTEKTGLTGGATVFVSGAIGQDRLFLTNDNEVSKKFYLLSGTEYFENEGIAAPTAGASATVTGTAGALTTGTHYIDFFYWNDDIAQPSDRRYDGANTLSVNVTATTDSIVVSGLPTDVVRDNDRATHVRIEVKKPSGSLFRYETQVALGTSSATISSLSEGAEAEYEHAVPPVHKCKAVIANRQFIGNVASHPYRVQYSAIVGATPYYESFPANNFRDFGKGEGDEITALIPVPPGLLLVGFKNSLWAMDPRRPGTSDALLLARGVGVANFKSWTVVGRRVFFISNADTSKGPYVWPGRGEPQYIPGVDDTFKGLNDTRIEYCSCGHLSPGDNRFQWWTLISGSGVSTQDTVLVYDYALNAWTVYKKPSGRTGNVLGQIDDDDTTKLYIGGDDGLEYQQDTGTNDAGTTYNTSVTMKAFDFGANWLKKRLRFIKYVLDKKTSGSVGITIERDFGNRGAVSSTIQQIVDSATAFTLGTSTLGGTDVLGGTTSGEIRDKTGFSAVGEVFKPTLFSEDQWHLKGIQFGIQPLGRK